MGISTWGLSWKHSVIFQNPASISPPPSTNDIITESGDQIITESGDKVVEES